MTDLKVLGPIEVTGETGSLNIGGPKQRRLLAALIVNVNSVVSSDQLMDVLWEGELPKGARRSFKAYVARLRTALDADGAAGLIVTHPSGYALEVERDQLDCTRFEQAVDRARAELAMGEVEVAARLLDDALAMWRGPAFGEFAGEEWARASAARLDTTRVMAHEMSIEAELAAGRHDELLPRIDELISSFPYRDGLRGLRMMALYRSGRQVDSLRDYQEYRQMLADEIGVEPGEELVQLEQRIVVHDADLLAPQPTRRKLRDYELGERVGASRHAVVYRGLQTSVGREVAVKVIRPEFANSAEFIHRFEAEAQLVASLEHPHVVPLYDFWREPGGAYLVMRWLDGGSVREQLERHGPFSVVDAVRLVDELGRALAIAHRAGIAHHELSPGNIMFDGAANAYLTDFAIAVGANGGTETTVAASSRLDIYTLGTLLYEVLVGSPPPGHSDGWGPDRIRSDLPPALEDVVRKACAADPMERFRDMADLVLAVRASVGSAMLEGVDDAHDAFLSGELQAVNPYRGLRAFGEGDSKDFFGREQLIDELTNSLSRSRFLALVGPSGSGKSSVVRAGLIPRLRNEGIYVATMVPGARPFDELERALLRVSPRTDPSLTAQLTATKQGIVRAIRGILPLSGEMLLVIDQFEELFTLADPELRDRFLAALMELVNDVSSPVRVVVTLRADFYDRPLLHPLIGPLVRDNTSAITALNAQELEAAITHPARRVGVDFEPALVAELVADAVKNPGTLPLLQYALTELYANRAGRRISAAEYSAMGGSSGILANRADALFDELGEAHAGAVQRLFTQLVTPGEGVEDTRRRALGNELRNIPDIVLDVYAKARLVTFDSDPVTRQPTVEVAHEALIREWPRLRQWIDEDRDGLRVLTHIAAAARTWDERGRDADELYRGARLAGAVEYQATHGDSLGPTAAEFLDESTNAADSGSRRTLRTTRRLRGLLTVAAIALVLALLAGLVAVARGREASDRAHAAEIEALLSASTGALDSDPQLATLLALEATRLRQDAASDTALFTALTNDSRRLATMYPRDGAVAGMALSGDGRSLVVRSDTSVEVFDLENLALRGRAHEGVTDTLPGAARVGISADGSTIAGVRRVGPTNQADQTTFIDVDSGVETAGPLTVDDGVSLFSGGAEVFFSPTDDALITSDRARGIIWATTSSAPVVETEGFPNDFSGNGQWLPLVDITNASVSILSAQDFAERATIAIARPGRTTSGFQQARLGFNGDHLVVLWSDTIDVYDVSTGEKLWELALEAGVSDVAFSSAGQIAVADRAGTVRRYELTTGTPQGRPYVVRPGVGGVAVEFRPEGGLVTGGQVIELWSAAGESPVGETVVPGDYGALFSPDRSLLATTDHEGRLFMHRVLDGEPVATSGIARNGRGVHRTPMVFSSDSTALVVVGGTGSDNTSGTGAFGIGVLQVLRPATGQVVGEYTYSEDEMTALALSPDESRVAVGYRSGRVELRAFPDVDKPISVAALGDSRYALSVISGFVFSADGRTLIVLNATGAMARVSTDTGERDLFLEDSPDRRTLSPLHGGRMVTASLGGALTVRDLEANQLGAEMVGHRALVTSLAVSDEVLVTAGLDSTVRFWDLDSQTAIGRPFDIDGSVVDMTEDGKWIAVIGGSGTAIWNLDPTTWTDAACRVAGRNLTQAEWDRFLPSDQPYHATCPQFVSV